MTFSKECQEYHLTPNGWVEGSFKGDTLGSGATKEIAAPDDRVLTIFCYDERPSLHSKPFYHDKVVWEIADKAVISQLQISFGKKPDWFGYKKMKK
ncbi:hypothetical protein [Desulforegula conservatrix]|uniref:hypothetical protein n=1 Tax=Desulforegula conservatrix TaxID=153026 RepID=UPI000556C218|nr:hypothetical protein [Desulforegula conservatrix]